MADHTLCDDSHHCFVLPTPVITLKWKNMNLAIGQNHNDVKWLYVYEFYLTFINNFVQFRPKYTSVHDYLNTWPVHAWQSAPSAPYTQVTYRLRIAFSCLCRGDITDPWPICIVANANIYCSVTNTVQYSPHAFLNLGYEEQCVLGPFSKTCE